MGRFKLVWQVIGNLIVIAGLIIAFIEHSNGNILTSNHTLLTVIVLLILLRE